MGYEKHVKTLNVALIALVILGLAANVLLYMQVQSVQDERVFLDLRLSEIQARIDDLALRLVPKTIHVRTISWDRQPIPFNSTIQGYVGSWTAEEALRIVHVEVWMGNPFDVLWEGDVFVMVNNTVNPWNPPPDTVLIHYQFDSHARSPLPHQKSFDLGQGFRIDRGETVYVYRLFNNFDENDTVAGDGWVMLYYTLE